MANYNWGSSEKAVIRLGQPYRFTKAQYEYCKNRSAPIAIVYIDTKTSISSRELYASAFQSESLVTSIYRTLSSAGKADPAADKYKGGYCCLFVLDRRGELASTDTDHVYFVNNILKSGSNAEKNHPFVVLALSYDGKISCQRFPDKAEATSFEDGLYRRCESETDGIGKFSLWAGRTAWLDHQAIKPDQETKPASTTLNDSIKTAGPPPYFENPSAKTEYGGYDPGRTGEFTGISKISNRTGATYLLNLADVMTPETTYMLIGSYDSNNPDNCPKDILNSLHEYMKLRCNRIECIWNRDCLNGGYKNLFFEGKKYRFFIFYEFSHGNNKSISIGISYNEIWNTFKAMRSYQRIWGIFDSCHSGSMIEHDGVTYQPLAAAQQPKSENALQGNGLKIIEYLEAKFERRSILMQAVTGGAVTQSAAAETYDPRMMLWSSTTAGSVGWYRLGSNTNFTNGFKAAMGKKYWKDYYYSQIRYGWSGKSRTQTESETAQQAFRQIQYDGYEKHDEAATPQSRNYPANDNFKTNIIFY